MSQSTSLTTTQQQVLALISAGFTATAAAGQAGVHRNTVANWLQSTEFKSALERARSQKELLYWDEAEALAAEAIGNLRELMHDPEVPAAVRLKAIVVMLEHARIFLPTPGAVVLPEPAGQKTAPTMEPTHKNAQEGERSEPKAPAPQPRTLAPASEVRPLRPKIGRNDLCPCGSGIKFKRCCLGKTAPPFQNAPAA